MTYTATTYWYARPGARSNRPPLPEEARRPVDEIRHRAEGRFEGEELAIRQKTGGITALQMDSRWSGGAQLWWRDAWAGDRLEFALPVAAAGNHEVSLQVTRAKAARELERSLGPGAFVEPKDALLYMSKRLLETDLAGDPPAENGPAAASGARVEREDSLFTILYTLCPDCRKASLPTAEGPIELPLEVVERVEPEASKVTITLEEELEGASGPDVSLPDAQEAAKSTPGPRPEPAPKPVPKAERDRPNTVLLVKKVRLREGGICGNPGCRRRLHLHAHHLEFRVYGGKTVLSNSLLLCDCCHSCVHLGLLKIEGNPFTGLTFRRKTIPTLADFQLELKELSSVPEIRLEVRSGIDSLGRNGASRRHSAIAGAPGQAWERRTDVAMHC